jgi:hypothetical protein
MAPDLVVAFVDAFNAEMRNLAASAERETLAANRTLAEIERKLAAIVRAIEDGAYTHTLKARLTTLEQEKVQTEARLHAGKRPPVLRLHTNLPEVYRTKSAPRVPARYQVCARLGEWPGEDRFQNLWVKGGQGWAPPLCPCPAARTRPIRTSTQGLDRGSRSRRPRISSGSQR